MHLPSINGYVCYHFLRIAPIPKKRTYDVVISKEKFDLIGMVEE